MNERGIGIDAMSLAIAGISGTPSPWASIELRNFFKAITLRSGFVVGL